MCGIVGAIARANVAKLLVENLKRLEYRGYDSAGLAVIDAEKKLRRLCVVGKIDALSDALQKQPLAGNIGIAHTRWATHGEPSISNAHPHISNETIAVVHNGIIENHTQLRAELEKAGYEFYSDTDTEIIAHFIHKYYIEGNDFLTAVYKASKELKGAFALAVINNREPDRMIALRCGSSLVIGLGEQENYIASDSLALLSLTNKFIYLDEGDLADVRLDEINIYDSQFNKVSRTIKISELTASVSDLGICKHYMQKEMFEQPIAVAETIASALHSQQRIDADAFGKDAAAILSKVKNIQIVACGSSYNAALVMRYWCESIAEIPCRVDIASEYRYHKIVVSTDTLFITISQSGETADTLAALRLAKQHPYLASLTICNVPESSLVRESDLVFMTRAGIEIGVATTKAFTSQLTALLILTLALARYRNGDSKENRKLLQLLRYVPALIEQILLLEEKIKAIAHLLRDKNQAFFLGRGSCYPIALEGALKMKEISYIHADAYPAGELKHGPLALIDSSATVVVVAPSNDELGEKLKSNIQEVNARGGELIVFANPDLKMPNLANMHVVTMPDINEIIAPIIYTIPLQLLAYHVAILKGTDVDQPRNLAKSVTVE